ncbi:hypothetical protein SCLARK_00787 [Spiroplasma clarkii]|uniref:hypothetical protein n=1 Tax=Spiroplasma clarkii TaxID=2139 RepID=UPI000B56DC4E|nr:hypothetical protein [Spiroplasma clarkii]ARU91418.1 hypothetical protein SCLARK_00787 [Spiroplasma clarkii]
MHQIIQQTAKNNFAIFIRLYLLALKSFFRSVINIFLGIVLITFVIFVWLLFHNDEPFLLASAVGAIIVRNGIHLFYRTLDMHKNGGLKMRLAYTPLSPWILPVAHIVANFTINLLLSCFLVGATLLFYPSQRTVAANVDWLFFVLAAVSLWILGVCMTFCVAVFVPSSVWGLIISIIFFIVSWNFLGITFPYHIIATYAGLNIALYLFPPRYMLNAMQAAWVGQRNLVFEDQNFLTGQSNIDYSVNFKLGGTMFVPFGVTYGIIILLTIVLITRSIKIRNQSKKDGFGSSLIQKLSNQYIRDIKRCTSFEKLNSLRTGHLAERGINLKKK